MCVLLLAAAWTLAAAQEPAVMRAALYLSGAASEEEVPSEWIELVENSSSVRVNADRLRPGLLSDYQIASLADYRASHGDILSLEELALVDGFTAEAVAALEPFLDLSSSRLPGNRDTVKVHGQLLLRGTLSAFGLKAKVQGNGWRVGGAWRGKDWTAWGEASGRWGRVVAGDMQLRSGQGLLLWTGFSMSSLSTVDAFVLRPTGITPCGSYASSGNRGLAYEYTGRKFRVSAFGTLGGLFGTRGEYMWRNGRLGATFVYENQFCFSLDGHHNFRGADLAWEAAWKNRSPSGKASLRLPLGERFRLALQARALPSRFSGKKYGEYALAVGGAFRTEGGSPPRHQASLTLDVSLLPIPGEDPRRFQLRAYGNWQWQLSPEWALAVRFTERYRSYERSRTALRADVHFVHGPWLSVARFEGVHCEKIGLLGYWEGGYKGSAAAGYFRVTGFGIPQWNDRIYTYERDAPGSFSVPAYYGEGVALSLVGNWKHRWRWLTLKLYGRGACMFRKEREPSWTLNLQLQAEF